MSNHTTGTWTQHPYNDLAIVQAKGDNVGKQVASVHHYAGTKKEEVMANAALIAAAPELLDALKKLVGWYDCFQLKEGEADLPVIVKSRAAIAKAEGR